MRILLTFTLLFTCLFPATTFAQEPVTDAQYVVQSNTYSRMTRVSSRSSLIGSNKDFGELKIVGIDSSRFDGGYVCAFADENPITIEGGAHQVQTLYHDGPDDDKTADHVKVDGGGVDMNLLDCIHTSVGTLYVKNLGRGETLTLWWMRYSGKDLKGHGHMWPIFHRYDARVFRNGGRSSHRVQAAFDADRK